MSDPRHENKIRRYVVQKFGDKIYVNWLTFIVRPKTLALVPSETTAHVYQKLFHQKEVDRFYPAEDIQGAIKQYRERMQERVDAAKRALAEAEDELKEAHSAVYVQSKLPPPLKKMVITPDML